MFPFQTRKKKAFERSHAIFLSLCVFVQLGNWIYKCITNKAPHKMISHHKLCFGYFYLDQFFI